jgi:hypothetical protein
MHAAPILVVLLLAACTTAPPSPQVGQAIGTKPPAQVTSAIAGFNAP